MVYLMESVCADRNLHESSELSVVAVFLCDTAGVVDLQNIYWWGKACTAHVSFSRFRLEFISFFCNKYIITWSCTAQVWSRLRLLVLGALRKRAKLCLPPSNFHLSRHQECKWNHSLGQRKHPSFSTIKRGGCPTPYRKKHLKFPFWLFAPLPYHYLIFWKFHNIFNRF